MPGVQKCPFSLISAILSNTFKADFQRWLYLLTVYHCHSWSIVTWSFSTWQNNWNTALLLCISPILKKIIKFYVTWNPRLQKLPGFRVPLCRKFAVFTYVPSIFSWIYQNHVISLILLKVLLLCSALMTVRHVLKPILFFWPYFIQFTTTFDLADYFQFL